MKRKVGAYRLLIADIGNVILAAGVPVRIFGINVIGSDVTVPIITLLNAASDDSSAPLSRKTPPQTQQKQLCGLTVLISRWVALSILQTLILLSLRFSTKRFNRIY